MADRATVAATAIMADDMAHVRGGKVTDHDAMRAAVTAILRDEIDAATRHARDDLKNPE
jgi:hypothetical protein